MIVSQAFEYYITEKIILNGLKEKTAKNTRGVLNLFLQCHGDISVLIINDVLVSDWKRFLMSRGLSSSTVSKSVGTLRSVLKFMREKKYEVIDYRDIDVPRAKYKPPTFVVSEDVTKLLDVATNARDKALIALLFSTGCRISEILNINRDDLRDDVVMVFGKGDKERPVFIAPFAKKLLDEYLEARKDKLRPLFISGQYRRITVSRVQQLLHVYADLAGIEKNITPHTFRHGMATHLLANGCDIRSLQQMLGHENISTTQIYTHLSNPQVKEKHQQFMTL